MSSSLFAALVGAVAYLLTAAVGCTAVEQLAATAYAAVAVDVGCRLAEEGRAAPPVAVSLVAALLGVLWVPAVAASVLVAVVDAVRGR